MATTRSDPNGAQVSQSSRRCVESRMGRPEKTVVERLVWFVLLVHVTGLRPRSRRCSAWSVRSPSWSVPSIDS
eukprot:11799591-Alexandrium_andersonii.AAC.1